MTTDRFELWSKKLLQRKVSTLSADDACSNSDVDIHSNNSDKNDINKAKKRVKLLDKWGRLILEYFMIDSFKRYNSLRG